MQKTQKKNKQKTSLIVWAEVNRGDFTWVVLILSQISVLVGGGNV